MNETILDNKLGKKVNISNREKTLDDVFLTNLLTPKQKKKIKPRKFVPAYGILAVMKLKTWLLRICLKVLNHEKKNKLRL